jgi:ABC-type antimicrobial peptide transport system permease subunit
MNFSGQGEYPKVWTVTPAVLAPTLKEEFPEVEEAVRLKSYYGVLIQHERNFHYETGFYFASSSLFDVFSFDFVLGDPDSSFRDPFSVVITEEMREKYFGQDNPLGKSLLVNKSQVYTVTGVIRNMPRNTHLQAGFFAPFEAYFSLGEHWDDWGRYDFPTYVLLRKRDAAGEFGEKIFSYIQKHKSESNTKLLLQPIRKIHLYSVDGGGSISYVYILSLIGFIVLLVACINFINLSTARASQRGKEVGVRKTVGAKRMELVRQLLGESLLFAVCAFFAGLVLVMLLISPFNNLSGKAFTLGSIFQKDIILGLMAIVLFTGMVSGSYPAFYLTSFHPVNIMRGSFKKGKSDASLRKVLVVAQFSISIVLIISTFVIFSQVRYIQYKNLGFDREHIVYIRLNKETKANIDVIQDELRRNPHILGTAAADRVPVNQGNFTTITRWDGQNSEKRLMFHVMSVDENYIDLLGLKMARGSKFRKGTSGDEIVVNEEAVRQMEMDSPLGKKIHFWRTSGIITGIIKDYHFKPLHTNIRPLIITRNSRWYSLLLCKIGPGRVEQTLNDIKAVFSKIAPDYPFVYRFLDESIDNLYSSERRTGLIMNVFTLLTVLTSCLGLFGLAAFTAQNRKKEIGIRKVLGASVVKIVSLLSSEFSRLVLLSNIIAWPIGFYIMSRWLRNYSYKIHLSLWIFVLAAVTAFVIALLTVSYQSIRASTANPVDSLKYE